MNIKIHKLNLINIILFKLKIYTCDKIKTYLAISLIYHIFPSQNNFQVYSKILKISSLNNNLICLYKKIGLLNTNSKNLKLYNIFFI